MKIGVITPWWDNENYGQVLQCYALQQYLLQEGHNPFLIQYKRKRSILSRIYLAISSPKELFSFYSSIWNKMVKYRMASHGKIITERNFDRFRNSYLIKSKKKYGSLRELNESSELNIDAYICGSDQVWRYFSYDSYGFANFLNFGPKKIKRIAYSASFGSNHVDQKYIDFVSPLIRILDSIAVREESGINICKQLGRKDAVYVMDPVFLCSKKTYDGIASPYSILQKEKYAFYYFLEAKMDIPWEKIKERTAKKELSNFFVPVYGSNFPFSEFQSPSIEEWIARIKNAKEVYTNSFHGTCYCIIFHRPFLTFLRKTGTMNDRLISLLNALNLSKRIYNPHKDLNEQMNSFIDWDSTQEKLTTRLQYSFNYLLNALKCEKS